MKNLTQIAIAAAMFCSAASSMAQSTVPYNPSWYFQPSISSFDADDRYGIDKTGEGAGLKFGKPMSEYWDMQFGTTYARTKGTNTRYTQNGVSLDGLYMFSRKSVRPFLLFGIGGERDKTDGPIRERFGSAANLSAGLGVQMDLSDRWSIQADARRVQGFLKQSDFGFKQSKNNYFTIGLNYVFDKPVQQVVSRPMPPAPVEAAPVVMQQTPPPPPAPVAPPAPRFERVTLSSTELFTFDSDKLRMPQPKLDEIANVLKNTANAPHINVIGHADRLGSNKYNMALSGRRATAVKNYLVQQGVPANTMSVVAKGESEPVVTCTEKNRVALIKCLEPNRRVVIEEITIERRVN